MKELLLVKFCRDKVSKKMSQCHSIGNKGRFKGSGSGKSSEKLYSSKSTVTSTPPPTPKGGKKTYWSKSKCAADFPNHDHEKLVQVGGFVCCWTRRPQNSSAAEVKVCDDFRWATLRNGLATLSSCQKIPFLRLFIVFKCSFNSV